MITEYVVGKSVGEVLEVRMLYLVLSTPKKAGSNQALRRRGRSLSYEAGVGADLRSKGSLVAPFVEETTPQQKHMDASCSRFDTESDCF